MSENPLREQIAEALLDDAVESGAMLPASRLLHLQNALRKADAVMEVVQPALDAARFAPLGDNHHNAALCPYCSPPGAVLTLQGQIDMMNRTLAEARGERDRAITALRDLLDHYDAGPCKGVGQSCYTHSSFLPCAVGAARGVLDDYQEPK